MSKTRTRTPRVPDLPLDSALWLADPALARCSLAARGLWMDLLCLMHQGVPYGHLAVDGRPLGTREVAVKLGRSPHLIARTMQELFDQRVLDVVLLAVNQAQTPHHPLELAAPSHEPFNCVTAPLLLRRERLRQIRARAGAQGGNPKLRNAARALPRDQDRPRPAPSVRTPSSPEREHACAPVTGDLLTPTPSTAGRPTQTPPATLHCPHEAIIDLYEASLPMLTRVLRKPWRGSDGAAELQKRWADGLAKSAGGAEMLPSWMTYASIDDGLASWRAFFERVSASELLTGQRGTWKADLRWLVKRSNFLKVLEGRYIDSQYTRVSPALKRFLAAYPRPGDDPVDVAIAWNRRDLDPQVDQLLAALEAWRGSESWVKDDGRFIPSAVRWLRTESFLQSPRSAAAATTATKPANALWATPERASRLAAATGDWRAIRFPGGYYLVSEDALVFDEQAERAQSLLAPFLAHGRIARMRVPPERVRLMAESYRAGRLVKPSVPLRDEELPPFPDPAAAGDLPRGQPSQEALSMPHFAAVRA